MKRAARMDTVSAGMLLFHHRRGKLRVLLAHPGGPYWRHRDLGAWSIPKGERHRDENSETAARRELAEELGLSAIGALQPLGEVRQRSEKRIEAFAAEGDFAVERLRSNKFHIEWPPGSGHRASFPEIDRAAWFTLELARQKIVASQIPFLDRLAQLYAMRRAPNQPPLIAIDGHHSPR